MGGSRTAPLPIASAGAIGGLEEDGAPEPEEPGSFFISAARKAPGEGEGKDQEGGSGGYDDDDESWGVYGWA